MKISAIVAGIIGAVAVCALDANSIWPIIIACICLAYLVLVVCIKWDELMRYWVSKGYWDYEPEDLGEIEDLFGKADIVEWDKRWNKK